MRIATFNVNSIRSRMDILINWMQTENPDVVCVQETKVQDAEFPEAVLKQAGWNVVFSGEKSYNGVAVISKHQLEQVIHGFDDGGPVDASRLLAVQVQDVTVVNTYVPQGRALDHEMYAYKLEWFKRLKKWLSHHYSADQALAWCGDINVARMPLDVKNPGTKKQHVCFHEDVRAAFEDVLQWGFTDVFREYHPDDELYSFFDYRVKNAVERNIGWRIDYVLATEPLRKRCKDSFIDLAPRRLEKPSDHTVLVADFL